MFLFAAAFLTRNLVRGGCPGTLWREGKGKRVGLLLQSLQGARLARSQSLPRPSGAEAHALFTEKACRKSQNGACAEGAEVKLRPRMSGVRGTMLSPEAERVLRYLVEVEELAEAVLSDKRQVRDAAARSALRTCAGSQGVHPAFRRHWS